MDLNHSENPRASFSPSADRPSMPLYSGPNTTPTSWSIFSLVLIGFGVFVILPYVLIYIVVQLFKHTPRKAFPSEHTYITNTEEGSVSDPLPLHQTWEYLTEPEVKANFTAGNKSSKILSSLLEKSKSQHNVLEDSEIELSLIVPCYNETERLHLLLEDAIPVLNLLYASPTDNQESQTTTKTATPKWELLLVDDGSSDGTAEYAVKWAAEQHTSGKLYLPPGTLRAVKLEKNRGKGGAVAHGMMHFRGKYAIFADADGASKSDDIRRLLTSIKEEIAKKKDASLTPPDAAWQYPVVAIGSRAHMVKTDAVVNRSFIRNFLMYGLHALVFIFGIRTIGDTQCGFKMFTRSAALSIFPYMHTEGWIFDVEILIIAMRNLIPVLEVPISWHEVAGSKVELARDSIKMAIDLVVMRLAFIIGVYSDGSASSLKYRKNTKTLKKD